MPSSAAAWECILTGTGTSVGVPQAGCGCAVCRSDDPRDKRLRAAALLRRTDDAWRREAVGPRHAPPAVVIDAGMDFRQQMLAHGVRRLDGVVLTHDHVDHIGGLDDIRPYCFYQQADLPVFADERTCASIRRRFDYIWNPPQRGGGLPRVDLRGPENAFTLAGLSFRAFPVLHGILTIRAYRIGDLGYVTDVSSIPEDSFAALSGVRWLVLGAAQFDPHPTHFHVDAAVDAARRVGAEKTFITHMNHQLGHRALLKYLPAGIEPGHDGLRLPVTA